MDKNTEIYFKYKFYSFLFFVGIISLLLFVSVNYVHADTGTDLMGENIITNIMCNVFNIISGPVAQGIATLVIVITGYSFFMGKVSSTMLFIIAAGIMMVFGAETLVGWLTGGGVEECGSDLKSISSGGAATGP